MNVLVLHELERLGLVDHDALMAEAMRRAESIHPPEVGASVARIIKTVFDGEAQAAHDAAGTNSDGTGAAH